MKKNPALLKTFARFLLIIVLGAIVFALIIVVLGGGFGRKEASLKSPGDQSVLLFAHRGSGNYFPENSIKAFDAAIASGFKAIETDIRLSADDSLVIFHDENCKRLLGIDTPLNALSFRDLKQYHILFNGVPSASAVITVDDLFNKMDGQLVVYLDVKLHDLRTAEKVAAIIARRRLESTTLVANSNLLFIAWLEYMHPEINTVLEGFTPGKEWLYTLIPKKLKPDFLASFAGDVNPDHMEWIRSQGLSDRRIGYGVNKENFHQAIDAGFQKLIMDFDSTLQDEISRYR